MNEDIKGSRDPLDQNNKLQSQIVEVQSHGSNNVQEKDNNTKKRKKGLKTDMKSKEVEVAEEPFNIYSRGKVYYAKIHGSATRPKRDMLKDLTEEEESQHICQCCGLPEEIKGKFEYFKTTDNPDDFSSCGQGVVLYYDYLKFVIMISLIASVGISLFNIYFSNQYYTELTKVCNNFYHEEYVADRNSQDLTFLDITEKCNFYMTDSDPDIDKNISQIETFFFRFSSTNIKDYRGLMGVLYDKIFESTIINISLINFIVLLVLFGFNLIYIYFLFNKSNAADYLVFTVSDYAVFLSNLFDLYNKFKENLEAVRKMEKKYKDQGKTIEEEWYVDKIGFKPTEDMIEIKMFERFLIEKIFKERQRRRVVVDYGVNRIDFCYKSKEIIELQQKLGEINEKISKIDFDPSIKEENDKRQLEGVKRNYYSYILPVCPFTCCPKVESLEDIMKEKNEIEQKMNELIQNSKEHISDHFGGAAFITFNKIKDQEKYLAKLPNNFFDYIIKFFKNLFYLFCSCCANKNSTSYYVRNITFEPAPEPEDIIFENIEISPLSRIIRTAIVYFISIILCGISFAAIYGLNLVQMHIDENQTNRTTHIVLLYVLSFAITGVTSVMDILLEIFLEKLTKWEKQTTWTNYYLSYSLKLTLFSFVNSAILPTFCEFFVNDSDGYEILISNMLMKFLVNALVTPIMWTLSVGFFIKKIRICLIEKKNANDITMNQKELNELYELPPMNVSAKYSYIAKTILMSFFYIPIFPLGMPISLLGFILGYWLEKYNFSNMYKTPEMLNRQITEFFTSYFVLVFFVYGIGDYVFLHSSYETRLWSLVNIILFGILIIFPYQQMLTFDYLKFDESSIHEDDYDKKYTDFPNDYERANPMTEREGKLRFLNAKKEKGIIKEDEFNEEKKEIENNALNQAFTYVGGQRQQRFGQGWGGGENGPHFGRRPHGFFRHGPHFGGFYPHGTQTFAPNFQGYTSNQPHGFSGQGYTSNQPHGFDGQGYTSNQPHGFDGQGYTSNQPQGFAPIPEGYPPHGEFGQFPHGFPPHGSFGPHGPMPQGYTSNAGQGQFNYQKGYTVSGNINNIGNNEMNLPSTTQFN